MHILIKNNNFLKESIKESLKYKYIPIILYNISYINKNQFKEDLQKIILQKKKSRHLSAIKIKLLKIDNSVPGFINLLKKDFDILLGQGGMNKINRFFIEQTQIDYLLNPHSNEYYNKIDFIHHFNSGLNQVLCKVAKQNKIRFFFSLNFTNNKIQFIKETGRINQNIKLASKYKVEILINFIIEKPEQVKSQKELLFILSMFNLSTKQKKDSFKSLDYVLNNKFNSENIVNDDIRIV